MEVIRGHRASHDFWSHLGRGVDNPRYATGLLELRGKHSI